MTKGNEIGYIAGTEVGLIHTHAFVRGIDTIV